MRVHGEGPKPATVMLIGEAPGKNEARTGRPFVGAAGQELNRFLEWAGLPRKQLYLTNLVKERPPFDADPTVDDIRRDEVELRRELEEVRPRVIGALGRFATRWLLPRLKDEDMATVHGVPYWREDGAGYKQIVVPVVHPAAGLHSPELMQMTEYDISRLAAVADGVLWPNDDEVAAPLYTEILAPELLCDVLEDASCLPIAIDTEGLPGREWGLSFSLAAGEAYVVRDPVILARFSWWLQTTHTGPVVPHNALHDIEILGGLGVKVPTERVVDTMVMAYNLRVEPQGLKALAFRHCGMPMQAYMDVVREAEFDTAHEYLESVLSRGECKECHGWGEQLGYNRQGRVKYNKCASCGGDGVTWRGAEEQLVYSNGVARIYKPQSVGRRVRGILKDASEVINFDHDKRSLDLRKRWEAIDAEVRADVEATLGTMPFPTLDDIPASAAIRYSARDADATIRVYTTLRREIARKQLDAVLAMDSAIIPMIDRMHHRGVRIDVEHFNRLSMELQDIKDEAARRLRRLAGRYVNPASGQQVAALLFSTLGLEPQRQTASKTADATDDKTLQGLKLRYGAVRPEAAEAIDLVLQYRQADKINGTYAAKLPKLVDANDRVHTRFKLTRTETGRLASADPNLQNIPSRSELGKRIRDGFIASGGCRLASWDYDQIEMRVLAHESEDENLIKVFSDGLDIHAMTASLVFRVPIDKVTKAQRTSAKNVGFGVVYGVSAHGLKAQMDLRGQTWTEAECQRLIDSYLMDAYPGVGAYMRRKQQEAVRTGAVRDMFGRIRYLPAANSDNRQLRAEAMRQAGNMPIQSAAAGVLKLAMAKLWNEALPRLHRQGLQIDFLLNVHDEVIAEFADVPGAWEVIDAEVRRCMSEAVAMVVPLSCSGNAALTWGALK